MRHSEASYPSEHSEHSEAEALATDPPLQADSDTTTPHQNDSSLGPGVVTLVTPVNQPVEPVGTDENGTLTMPH